jgi:transposase InsO family protein
MGTYGGPMKGATMVATLEKLAVLASWSRPSLADDNPYSEALFRTLKYRSDYPHGPLENVETARSWISAFALSYNTTHLHSGIRFATPDDQHFGRERAILARRRTVYAKARAEHPERWARGTRNWDQVAEVTLNPPKENKEKTEAQKRAA